MKNNESNTNRRLNSEIMGIVNNQLENGKPVETQKTYDRLIDEGYSDDEARNLIGHVVVREIYDMIEEEKKL